MEPRDLRPQRQEEFQVREVDEFDVHQLLANRQISFVEFSTTSGNIYRFVRHPDNGQWFLVNKRSTENNRGMPTGEIVDLTNSKNILQVGKSFRYQQDEGATTPVQSIRVYEQPTTRQPSLASEVGLKKPDLIVAPENGITDPVIIGDLSIDGFMVLQSNHKSGQDAFAIDRARRRFVICDGMGSYSKSGVVARALSQAIAESPLTLPELFPTTATTVDEVTGPLKAILAQIKDTPEYMNADENGRGSNSGHTTLTIAEKQANGSWVYVVIGDSPLYANDAEGAWHGVGNETIGDQNTGISLGIKDDQVSIYFGSKAEGFKRGTIPARPGLRLTIASDWLSDNLESRSREFAEHEIKRFKQEIEDIRTNRYFMYDNGGRQRPVRVDITDEAHLQKVIAVRNEWIQYYNNQLARREPFNPFIFEDVCDPQELLKIAKGEERLLVMKPDDFTQILIDSDKI